MIQIRRRGGARVTASETSGSTGSGLPPRESWWARLNQRLGWKGWTGVAAIAALLALVLAILGLFMNSGSPASSSSKNYCDAQGNGNTVNCSGNTTNNYGAGLSKNSQARIVQLTGSFSDKGFADAIFDRDTSIVALYLKSGMSATTLYEGASAILFGFEGLDQNGDPIQSGDAIALVKTFQAAGFKIDEDLQDSYLMGELTDGTFPLMFDTALAPKGYTGGYQNGTFVGSLLFWIVQRALGWGPTDQDIQVIHYLVSQGADCKIPLSFLDYNTPTLAGTSPYKELLPMMQSCAE
jgi:hypothetical protein